MIKLALLSTWHVHTDWFLGKLRDSGLADFVIMWDEDPIRGKRFAEEHGIPFEETLEKVLSRQDVEGVVVECPTILGELIKPCWIPICCLNIGLIPLKVAVVLPLIWVVTGYIYFQCFVESLKRSPAGWETFMAVKVMSFHQRLLNLKMVPLVLLLPLMYPIGKIIY